MEDVRPARSWQLAHLRNRSSPLARTRSAATVNDVAGLIAPTLGNLRGLPHNSGVRSIRISAFWRDVFSQALGTVLGAGIIYAFAVAAGLVTRPSVWQLIESIFKVSMAMLALGVLILGAPLLNTNYVRRKVDAPLRPKRPVNFPLKLLPLRFWPADARNKWRADLDRFDAEEQAHARYSGPWREHVHEFTPRRSAYDEQTERLA